MKRNFTRLVCAGIVSCYMLTAMGQEKMPTVRMIDRDFLENGTELRADKAEWWPDSVIYYNYAGESTAKWFYDQENRTETFGFWENGSWELGEPRSSNGYYLGFGVFNASISESDFSGEDKMLLNFHQILTMSQVSYSKQLYSYNAVYDDRDNLILVEITLKGIDSGVVHGRYSMKYNEDNNLLSVEYDLYGVIYWKDLYEYNENGDPTYFKSYTYNRENDLMEMDGLQQVKYDEKGRPVEAYDLWLNAGKNSTYYMLYYSDETNTPDVEAINNHPVSENEGGFDLDINIPLDSISTGSVTITLPEGFTLDEDNTTLAVDFAGLFDLTVTKQEDNTWLIEIKLKSLKSDMLKADEAGTMLHVAYKVDDTLPKGTYDISVNSILFETPDGNLIPEPALTVPAAINRFGVSNEQIGTPEITAYITDYTLYINADQPDEVSLYTVNGAKVYETTVQPGTTTVNTASLPQGMLILKGNSGWVKKVINK